jgi:hypothetical protein
VGKPVPKVAVVIPEAKSFPTPNRVERLAADELALLPCNMGAVLVIVKVVAMPELLTSLA